MLASTSRFRSSVDISDRLQLEPASLIISSTAARTCGSPCCTMYRRAVSNSSGVIVTRWYPMKSFKYYKSHAAVKDPVYAEDQKKRAQHREPRLSVLRSLGAPRVSILRNDLGDA